MEVKKVDQQSLSKHCKGCMYMDSSQHCIYIIMMDKQRPCPPGKDCTVKTVQKKKKKRIQIRGLGNDYQ